MSGKMSEYDPFERAKNVFSDELLEQFLAYDLQKAINSILHDSRALVAAGTGFASLLRLEIEDEKLNHLDDKMLDSEDTLRDLIVLVTRYTQATNHIFEFIQRYNRSKWNLERKAAYRDNFPDL